MERHSSVLIARVIEVNRTAAESAEETRREKEEQDGQDRLRRQDNYNKVIPSFFLKNKEGKI